MLPTHICLRWARTKPFRLTVFASLLVLGMSPAFADDDEVVDKAPSGNEQSVVVVSPNSTMTMPGRNAPVTETREGNTTRLEFHNPPAASRDTTIIYHK